MTNESTNSITEILDGLKGIVEHERRLFGDVLLFEAPTQFRTHVEPAVIAKENREPAITHSTKHYERPVSPKKQVVAEEPALFDVPKSPSPPITPEAWGASATLDNLNAQICTCMKCALGATRTKFVFGVGNPHATLMVIGEAPGADEDAQGEPFVGRAGQLLNKILEAINFKRSDVYICNILKCRPPSNRKPTPEESELCKPYLKKQIELVKPKIILCLGLTAAENLLGTKESMGSLRGRVMQYENVPVMITYHPAALLRNPNWKRPAWKDVQAVRKLHDELITQRPNVENSA